MFFQNMFRPVYISAFLMAVAGCASQPMATGTREPADIAGVNYNRGTFACVDKDNGLESRFTFGESTASLTVKGESVALSCDTVGEADPQLLAYFKNSYVRVVDLCSGNSSKGKIVTGTSNSMGAVQMTAFRLDASGGVANKSILNCSSAKKEAGGGW